ncbi:hypothetical protein SAMN05421741_12611 [Paenimyroides ummariense]|uniref:Lipoprotein n=1 Tax=Paenimyroides ummariense TaxID=913024 RepID=A0A1I5F9C4_9FLAO|nr:hypothetical protein [Paenimyroides ummariense]SFO20355.1 hypothetical protein SAMN05421741_12611 [Paenimyroides ummariense]
MIRISLILIYLLLVTSCKQTIHENSNQDKVYYGKFFYCNVGVTTIKSINCEEFIENLESSISYFEIYEREFGEKITINIHNPDSINFKPNYIDVRYKLEFDNNIICVDYFGYYSLNDKIMGKFKDFNLIIEYINKNKDKSIRLKELPDIISIE